MSEYSQIIACVDITGEEDQVMERAMQVAVTSGATLSIVHVVRPLNYFYASDFSVDVLSLQEEIQRNAKARIQQLAQKMSPATVHQYVFTGTPKNEIHRLANDIKADLIVIGTHGRHGVGLLLGSTANAVLHGTPCDVLVVRIKNDTDKPAG